MAIDPKARPQHAARPSSDNAGVKSVSDSYRQPAEHYENFPVASWLCPPALRAPIAAIYWFARTADDIADEGAAAASQRLADLAQYRADLACCSNGAAHSGRWPQVFDALSTMVARYELPVALLERLLDAFVQDVQYTADGRRYQSDAELLDYCRRSANPVGRLLLHLYGIDDPASLRQSDQICSALQLINFWQDLRGDIARARWYPSAQRMREFGVADADLLRDADCPRASAMLAAYSDDAGALMRSGAPLAARIPGRAGWELRLVIQGGLRILEKMAAMNHTSWRRRVRLGKRDWPRLLWRAWRSDYRAPALVRA